MIETKRRENENLGKLKNQMKDMSNDFEDMKNARIESKRQLEQRRREAASAPAQHAEPRARRVAGRDGVARARGGRIGAGALAAAVARAE